MIRIRITETGFVSGNAWETVGYEGDAESRIVHTTYHKPCILGDSQYVAGYKIKSKLLGKVVSINLNEKNDIEIPREFMAKSQKLWFQFYIKSNDTVVFHSNPFHLNIESSVGKDADVILKPGANLFIVVDTLEDRDNIPRSQLADGKVVKVNDVDGEITYYSWDNTNATWVLEVFGIGTITINDIVGLADALSWHSIEGEDDNE